MGVITSAVAWALAIANDETHGYDQTNRWGPDYDCSSLVIEAYERAGVPVRTNGASYTGNMVDIFLGNGFTDITDSVNFSTGAGLKTGDVVWVSGHVEMISRKGYLVGASINENGNVTGGLTGDQTGAEIRERTYYNYPWTFALRYVENVDKSEVVKGNRYLTMDEMKINARYIYQYFTSNGWTLEAIAGMLGNMQTESTINPAIWQSLDYGNTSLGYGLVQWTPSTKVTNWLSGNGYAVDDIEGQCARILYEMAEGIQYYSTEDYPESFREFSQSTKSPEYLAYAFLNNYERAKDRDQPNRQSQARFWYNYLYENGTGDSGNTNIKIKKHKMSLLLMSMALRR